VFIPQNKGYFSKTTNSFQIGIISEGQWIGDEILILAQKERQVQMNQSKMATTQMRTTVFQKTQENFENDTPNTTHVNTRASPWIPQIKKEEPVQKVLVPGTYLEYSVVTKSDVIAYVISKEDLVHKLPKDISSMIGKQAIKKMEWISKRQQEIQKDINKLYNMESSY